MFAKVVLKGKPRFSLRENDDGGCIITKLESITSLILGFGTKYGLPKWTIFCNVHNLFSYE